MTSGPGPTVPALYEATVTHTRRVPRRHSFRYSTYFWLVDVDSPPELPGWLRFLARFEPRDHLDIRGVLEEQGVTASRVVMLANARVLGYVFNPITLYWCYGKDGSLAATVAEVHNTYGDRHAYILPTDEGGRAEVDKAMYVSPFNPAAGRYEMRVSEPGGTVSLSVVLRHENDRPFVATMVGRRRPADARTMAVAMLRYPWAPLRVAALIRWQGARLWLKGLEVQPR